MPRTIPRFTTHIRFSFMSTLLPTHPWASEQGVRYPRAAARKGPPLVADPRAGGTRTSVPRALPWSAGGVQVPPGPSARGGGLKGGRPGREHGLADGERPA